MNEARIRQEKITSETAPKRTALEESNVPFRVERKYSSVPGTKNLRRRLSLRSYNRQIQPAPMATEILVR